MKYISTILLCSLFSLQALCQFAEKDSLLKIVTSNAHDSVKSDALNELAFYMFDYNVDSSILFATRARQLAVKAGNIRQQARAIKNIGISYDINVSSLKAATESRGGSEFSIIYIKKPPTGNKNIPCPKF